MRGHARREDGQALVELALVLPILFAIMLGTIQLALGLKDYLTLADAVRTGARQAAVSRGVADPTGATTTVVRNAASDLRSADLTVTVTSTWEPGTDVTVSASYPLKLELLGVVFADRRMSSTTKERVE
jgi:Flp pilus assembly protein TadG